MKYFIIAGEASGDLHASNLMHELKRLDPQADFLCLGGDARINLPATVSSLNWSRRFTAEDVGAFTASLIRSLAFNG